MGDYLLPLDIISLVLWVMYIYTLCNEKRFFYVITIVFLLLLLF